MEKATEANSKPWEGDKLQKRREKYALIPPWLNPKANVANWANAQYFHIRFNNGEQLKTIALSSGITENQLKTLVKHFRAGWNPNEDQRFLDWVSSLKEVYVTSFITLYQ